MSENRNSAGDTLLTLLVGAAAGLAAGFLLAPKTGRETRRRVLRWLEGMEGRGEELMEEAEALWEKGKDRLKGSPGPSTRKGDEE